MNYELLRSVDGYIKQKGYRQINSILLYKEGEVILEAYYNNFTADTRNNIKSIWKSILSVCTGICLDKGYIKSLDEPIGNYLKEFSCNAHPYHKLITIRHLLTMTSGIYWNGGVHYHCPMLEQLWRSGNCLEELADTAMENVPGAKFVYKEWDVILLSAVLSIAAGMNSYEFCKRHLYEPLGITSGQWASLSNGVNYNISRDEALEAQSNLSARDLAKLGLLFLEKGKGLVSRNYVEQAISPSPGARDYGFLWWLFDGGYGCRGYGGQEISVIPDSNIVYVMQATATSRGMSYPDVFRTVLKELKVLF